MLTNTYQDKSYFFFFYSLLNAAITANRRCIRSAEPQRTVTWTHLVEEIELLVKRGADLHQAGRVGLRLVGADGSDPDVAQVGDVQGAVGGHGQRGGRLQAGVAGVAAITWQGGTETGGS